MIYPSKAFDRALHIIPGGHHVAHYADALRRGFDALTVSDNLRDFKLDAVAKFLPLTQQLENMGTDRNGRAWKTFAHLQDGNPDGTPPKVLLTFAHLTKAEERAFHYLKRHAGSETYPAPEQPISRAAIERRCYEVIVEQRPLGPISFKGMTGLHRHGTHVETQSPYTHRFEHYMLNTRAPEIMGMGAQAQAPAPASTLR